MRMLIAMLEPEVVSPGAGQLAAKNLLQLRLPEKSMRKHQACRLEHTELPIEATQRLRYRDCEPVYVVASIVSCCAAGSCDSSCSPRGVP